MAGYLVIILIINVNSVPWHCRKIKDEILLPGVLPVFFGIFALIVLALMPDNRLKNSDTTGKGEKDDFVLLNHYYRPIYFWYHFTLIKSKDW